MKHLQQVKERIVIFSYNYDLIAICDGELLFKIPIADFVINSKLCFEKIRNSLKSKVPVEIPHIERTFLSFFIQALKAQSKIKNEISVKIEDTNTFNFASLVRNIIDPLEDTSVLVNASGATNFTYTITGKILDQEIVDTINSTEEFSDKFKLLNEHGVSLVFEGIDNKTFKSNLQTIDYNFGSILSEMLIHFYENDNSSEKTIPKIIEKVTLKNSIGYDLSINSRMYELMIKKFLTDYALGMRAGEVWQRDYQATGGYLIVREDGEIICYHFYFTKSFEDYLFNNTRFETGSPNRHEFGSIYSENGIQKIKLNLQIRFIK